MRSFSHVPTKHSTVSVFTSKLLCRSGEPRSGGGTQNEDEEIRVNKETRQAGKAGEATRIDLPQSGCCRTSNCKATEQASAAGSKADTIPAPTLATPTCCARSGCHNGKVLFSEVLGKTL